MGMINPEYKSNGLEKKVPYTWLYMGVFQSNIYLNVSLLNYKLNYKIHISTKFLYFSLQKFMSLVKSD